MPSGVEGLGGKLRARRVDIKKNHLGAAARKAAAVVASPIVPAPPVMTTTCPCSGCGFRPASFACSSDQYSISNWSRSEMLSKRPPFFRVRNHRNRGLRNVGRDTRIFCSCPDTEQPDRPVPE